MGSKKKSRLSVGKKGKVLRPRKRAPPPSAPEAAAHRSIDSGQERHAAPGSPHSLAAGLPASAEAIAVEALFMLHAGGQVSPQRAE
jgi:hypothetical protein